MPFHDLNVPYTSNHADLSNTLAFHGELGYGAVALALSVTGKLPSQPQPVPVSQLTIPKSITKILTRLTITISDATQNHRLTSFQPHYDLLALRPTTEKALQLCCNSLDCDIISLDFGQRLPFILKFKTVASALQRGIRFEICYSPGISPSSSSGGGSSSSSNDARRNLIANAGSLIRATRGRGIILSSDARNALGVRGPYDVINLAQVWGLGQERGKEALCEEAGKVVRLAGMKRTSFRGVIDVIDGGGGPDGKVASTSAVFKTTSTISLGPSPIVASKQSKQGVSTPSSDTNGTKRKASNTSLNGQSTTGPVTEETHCLSKREQKRRAKKARMEGKAQEQLPSGS
ncbi:ribonuclease P/MRP protein subunit RPP1 [Exophiala aquamarina CBS 119918]|uniref:Ribonuclease P/MRP protein subunit RPP1 n=1 Tax=Exophiala aquamarina CBS 119918 TaxID=1182545 RepID=A0A072PJ53_9EURO|nr:ribonuclease P/MRP protein subunit RPP1 [Exophiala aquamarina CBS 119918]KEF60154.1 ribonuclease P/MRP protein subunit RPP1 [Exophiala aquamarina CBS 119918]